MLIEQIVIENLQGKSRIFDVQTGLSGSVEFLNTNGVGGKLKFWGSNGLNVNWFLIDEQTVSDIDFGVLYDIDSMWFNYVRFESTLGSCKVIFKKAIHS
jgi:hypothetical protein